MNGINRINSEPPKPATFEDLGYVQVVRCKDCIHGNILYPDYVSCLISDENESGCHLSHNGNWYCADGVAKDKNVFNKIDWKKELVDDFEKYLHEDYKSSVCPEIEGDRHSWYYVCGECHGQVNWHDAVCRHCKARLDWNG